MLCSLFIYFCQLWSPIQPSYQHVPSILVERREMTWYEKKNFSFYHISLISYSSGWFGISVHKTSIWGKVWLFTFEYFILLELQGRWRIRFFVIYSSSFWWMDWKIWPLKEKFGFSKSDKKYIFEIWFHPFDDINFDLMIFRNWC